MTLSQLIGRPMIGAVAMLLAVSTPIRLRPKANQLKTQGVQKVGARAGLASLEIRSPKGSGYMVLSGLAK